MGKSKKKKFKASRLQPTGLPSVKEFEAELENDVDGTVAGVLEKLQSANIEERECGCSTLANLVNQPTAIPVLLKQNIVKLVGPLIIDQSPHVRHGAIGALRNLSVDGGHEVCEEMIRNDIMTPLVVVFQKYGVGWNPERVEGKKHRDSAEEIFTEAVHLLWNLCESSDLAVSIFNKENLIQCLLPCLQFDIYGYETAIAVAHCLHTVTEDNKTAAMFCKGSDVMSLLQKFMVSGDTAESVLLTTLVTGILVNVCGYALSCGVASMVSAFVESVARVLSVDPTSLIQTAAQNGSQNGTRSEFESECAVENSHHQQSEPQGKLKDVECYLMAEQVSLEITANLCCSEDDWEDFDSSESSSSDDMAVDMQIEDSANESFTPLCIPTEVHGAFLQHDMLTKVMCKAEPLDESKKALLETCPGGQKIIKSFHRVQTHALLCVNNMVNAMEASALGGLGNLHKMWEGLSQLSLSKQAWEDLELLEAVTSAMRAVVAKLAELESPKFSEITINDLQFLFDMSQNCENNQVRVNAIRCMSTVGCLLAKNKQPHHLLKDIGQFLIDTSGRDSDLWVVAEALDSIFDVFGEDHIDLVVRAIGLVEKLKNILPVFKSKINSHRKSLGEHYPVVSTARTNLIRFIKYKLSV